MCEGHNLFLQNYLRELVISNLIYLILIFACRQSDNVRSIDLVSTVVEVMKTIIEDINKDNMPLIIQVSIVDYDGDL